MKSNLFFSFGLGIMSESQSVVKLKVTEIYPCVFLRQFLHLGP